MSYQTWVTNGYGICVDDIVDTDIRRVRELCNKNKELKTMFEEAFITYAINELGTLWDDYGDDEFEKKFNRLADDVDLNSLLKCFGGDWVELGMAYIIKTVFEAEEGIELVYAEDYDCVEYLLYVPSYPWSIPEKEKNLTEDDIRRKFAKHVKILTDEPINVDYYSVENGG